MQLPIQLQRCLSLASSFLLTLHRRSTGGTEVASMHADEVLGISIPVVAQQHAIPFNLPNDATKQVIGRGQDVHSLERWTE